MKSRPVYVRKLRVPIYEATVHVVVAIDLGKERSRPRWTALFGDMPNAGDFGALCARGSDNWAFGLFFRSDYLLTKVVAHEVFHLTHRIMERTGEPFDETKHEQGACLYGWLFEQVNALLNAHDRHSKRG